MMTVDFKFRPGVSPKVLCLGAQCDDIAIGCGCMLLRMARQYPLAEICWVVLSGTAERAKEERAAIDSLIPGTQNKSS